MPKLLKITAATAALLIAVVAVIILGAVVYDHMHAPVTRYSLATSLADEAGSSYEEAAENYCVPLTANAWKCHVAEHDFHGDGSWVYRVAVKPQSSCWTARLIANESENSAPYSPSGCVTNELFQGIGT